MIESKQCKTGHRDYWRLLICS